MLIFTRSLRVCLAVQAVDLRAGFEKLALLVREELAEDERSSQVFVFGNRRRDRVKLLYWDGTGLWILTKKLEAGNFAWPRGGETKKLRMKAEALELLLSGMDLKGVNLRPWYEEPAGEAGP
jgi:transposase